MPGYISDPSPVGVFPFSLSTKFASSRKYESRVTEYHDGTTERAALVNRSRRTWTASKRLTLADAATLRTFWEAHQADAFYFYDMRETVPLFSYDPTGAATDGRYIVRFASDWRESIGMPRTDLDVTLIELAGSGDIALGSITAPTGVTVTSGFTLYVVSEHDITHGTGLSSPETDQLAQGLYAANGSLFFNALSGSGWGNGGGSWTQETDTCDLNGLQSGSRFAIGFETINAFSANALNVIKIYDLYVQYSLSDGTTGTIRPLVYASGASNQNNYVANPGNAVDGDPATYAEVHSDERDAPYRINPPSLMFVFQ